MFQMFITGQTSVLQAGISSDSESLNIMSFIML